MALITTFQAELHNLLGDARRGFASFNVVQSDSGPTIQIDGDAAVVIVGPNATQHEPTLTANLAHESVHLHVTDGEYGNASGLEEGFALHFELSAVERHYGFRERSHHVNHLPATYATALSDYERLLTLTDRPAMRVYEAYGKLTGVTSSQLRRLFPALGWWMSRRLAGRRQMRKG